jgi:integrase
VTAASRKTDPIRKITTKNGETRYRFIIDVGKRPDGKRDQRCYTFRTMKEARAERSKIIADRSRGTLVKRTSVTFDELCKRWLASKHDVREVTRVGYADHLKVARAQLGRMKVQDITRSDVESVIRSVRDRGLSHRSMVVTLGRIRQVLAYGITEGVVSIDVAASVRVPRRQHGDVRPSVVWEAAELLQFRAVADQDEWAAAWRLTLCGLRRSEVMGLSWDAVDLDRGEIVIKAGRVLLDGHRTATEDPKSSASHRTVPVEEIQPGTVALLRSLKARQAADRLVLGSGYPDTGYVLVDPLGKPIRPDRYSDQFAVLCRRARVRAVHVHAVRHTLALIMHRAGLAPADAAALLGHTVAVHLSTYVPLTEKGARAAASGLGAAIAGVM